MQILEVSDVQLAEKLSCFFVDNIPESYISSGDVVYGRADASFRLVPNLRDVIKTELEEIISNSVPNKRALVGLQGDSVVALAIVAINAPAGTIEDLVVAKDARGKGVGKAVLSLIYDFFREKDISTVFLESGVDNHDAHGFFTRQGFKPAGVLFVKEL